MSFRLQRPLLVLLAISSLLVLLGACQASETEFAPIPTTAPAAQPEQPARGAPAATAAPAAPAATAVPTSTLIPTSGLEVRTRGGILRSFANSQTHSLEPLQVNVGEQTELEAIYGYLIGITPEGVLVPELASSWEATADGSSLIIRIQTGIKFHDGSDVDAAAVKAHLDRVRNPEWNALGIAFMEPIDSVDLVNSMTLRIDFKVPDVVVLGRLATREGMIPSKKAMDNITPDTLDEFANNPVGAGPFKFGDWRPDSHLTLERWDKSFAAKDGLPYLDGLKRVYITDAAVALAAFRTKELDTFIPTAQAAKELEKDSRLRVHYGWRSHYGYIHLDRTVEPLDDVRVRKAISMALDREALVDLLTEGRGTPIYNMISPHWGWLYDPDYERNAYNPEEAKRLLAEAGYPDGVTIPGPMVWYLGQNKGPWGIQEAVAEQSMLAAVGIRVELSPTPTLSDAYVQHFFEGKFPMMMLTVSCGEDPDRCIRENFHSSSPQYSRGAPIPGLDDLIDKQRQTLDPAERKKIIWQAIELIVDNQVEIFTYTPQLPTAIWNYVKGYQPNPGNPAHERWWLVSLED